jgi:hypothetical protein
MISVERKCELIVQRDKLMFKGQALQNKYQGLLSVYQGICMDGSPHDVESMREKVVASVGDILDNMYAQHLIGRELSGISRD